MAKNHKKFHTKLNILPPEPDNTSNYEDILDKYCIDWDYWYDDDWYDDYYYPYRTTEIESICDDPAHILCSFCPLYDEKNDKCLGNSTRFAEMQVIKKVEDDFINDFLQRLL